MLALKKKREAEAKAAAEAPAATAEQPASTEKVSLLGIGGKKKTKSGENSGTKKRTPGEIRIQKGALLFVEAYKNMHNRFILLRIESLGAPFE
jgi:hypothetical protein